jgi:hypothetical protein
MTRLEDIARFYGLMDGLAQRLGGPRRLADCSGRLHWPRRGVYFFMEDGEVRSNSGSGPRIVRIGTHAVSERSRTTLWNRLSQHRGTARSGGGNHRGSVFRLLVGTALIGKGESACATWNNGQSSASPEVRAAEQPMEQRVSETLGAMRLLWLTVDDPPGKDSERRYIERGAIALLSNFGKPPIDPPSRGWLGQYCASPSVRDSGLWNQNHIEEDYARSFLDRLEALIAAQGVS